MHADFVKTAGFENVFENLDVKPLLFKKSLRLQDVSFCYPGCDELIISDLSIEIQANTTIGLVGLTGSGKTTLIDIIIGMARTPVGKYPLWTAYPLMKTTESPGSATWDTFPTHLSQ